MRGHGRSPLEYMYGNRNRSWGARSAEQAMHIYTENK